MHVPSAAQLLELWEVGTGSGPVQRALLLLAAAWPERPLAGLAAEPIGWCDGQLLTLRRHLFGDPIEAVVDCPQCGTRLELSLRGSDFLVTGGSPAAPPVLERDGYCIQLRLPTTLDLLELPGGMTQEAARALLLARCIVEARSGATNVAAEALPPTVVEAAVQAIAAADPQAELWLALQCPECGHPWQALFDIASFLWRELEAWAQRTLYAIDRLARAYGWSEAEILALSARRRQTYLEMVS